MLTPLEGLLGWVVVTLLSSVCLASSPVSRIAEAAEHKIKLLFALSWRRMRMSIRRWKMGQRPSIGRRTGMI